MIRAVTFDLWQTLITEKPEEEENRRALRFQRLGEELRALGFDPALEALQEAYQACGLWLQEIWTEDRDVPTREHMAFLLRALGLDPRTVREPDWEHLEEAYTSPIRAIPPVVLPGAAETLHLLSSKGLWLGLVCNTGRTRARCSARCLKGWACRAISGPWPFPTRPGSASRTPGSTTTSSRSPGSGLRRPCTWGTWRRATLPGPSGPG